tara:strand:+ start:2133 stop:2276 length:144 start_codon:yes stop_codon:yes gene_type:complete
MVDKRRDWVRHFSSSPYPTLKGKVLTIDHVTRKEERVETEICRVAGE